MSNPFRKFFKSGLKLVRGTRFVSFLFIGLSIMIAAGILFAANMYYNIDTGEVVVEEIERVTGTIRAITGLIVGGTASQNPSVGYVLEVVGKTKLATTTIVAGTPLEFPTSTQYAAIKAPADYGTTTAITYIFPQHGSYPPQANYVLTWTTGDQLKWQSVSGVGAGDITAVGNCPSGECFTGGTDGGNQLWFEGATPNDWEIILTAADPAADYTITLPAATGYVALGTSTANYVAYWSATNTLAGEQYLSTGRGGIGESSAGWSGMVKVVSGDWQAYTGTSSYAAYWSDANTVGGEQYLNVIRGGTGAGTFTQYGVIYGMGTGALGVTAAGGTDRLLVGAGTGAAPTWKDIADLINATNGLTESGTSTLTLKLGGILGETTTITATSTYDMIFNLTGTGDFKVQDLGTDILVVSDDGKIYYKTYPLAEPGKQVLREMIPILGFDLPPQTASTSYVTISRTLENYPFAATSTGATRVHKFVIRYVDDLPTASTSDWRVYNVTDSTTTASFTVAGCNETDFTTAKGKTQIVETSIPGGPGNDKKWRLDVKIPSAQSGKKIRVFEVFLAAYDQIL